MLRLRTLGGLSLEGSEGPPITAGSQRRRLALFALLASAGDRGVSRDKLIAYLWPETEPDRAREALTQMIAAIRTDTGTDDLFHGSNEIRLDPARCSSDVAEFEQLLDRRELGAAVNVYGGVFLDTFTLPDAPEFQRWVERERVRLEQRYRGALEALASEAKSAGEHLAAARWWRRLADVDPMSSHVALEVMSALAAAGDHPGAVAHAAAHEKRIREEFGAAPNQAVRALAEKLKADPSYTPPPAPRASAPYRRSSGRKIVAPGPGDFGGDADLASTTSRERGAMIAGRYMIQRELGKGGMATVFLAHDLKFDRDVALKFIHAELADAFGTERFQSEIAVLAKLQHPHILALYDSGEVEGALFYVMPYVGGESVRDKLQREGQLPITEALRLAREVAGALAYAHEQGVIHRDIKPENILLSNGHALVADFGIARAVSRAAGRRNTEDGFAVGTPAYMSPEQASGDPIDGRSDEYALACVIYEMLGGTPPFIGTSGRSVIAQRFTEEPPSIKKVRQSVPTEVDHALQKALSRVPADRYATVSEFARALDVIDTLGRPRRSTTKGVAATLGRWKWVIAVLAAAAIIATLLALRPPPLVPDLYAVLPFQHPNGVAPRLLSGNACQRLLYDAFDRWMGLKLVDGIRQGDAERRHGDTAITLADAFAIARGLRAGRLVWGQVSQFEGDIQVHGVVYDVARGTRGQPIRQYTVHIDSTLTNAADRFDELADSLLVGAGPATAAEGMRGTRSLAALRAYAAGHEALGRWDLLAAESLFRASTLADPGYAHAHFWLAQTMSWANNGEPTDWREVASRAYAARNRLGMHERQHAAALYALSTGDYPDACAHYAELASHDTLDFAAWYGLGECRRRDRLVVKDAKSPSGMAFRGSYQAAINAYDRALRIVPSVHLAFAGLGFERLSKMLLTQSTQVRRGYALERDTTWFGGFATLDGDTLAIVPYPFEEITSEKVQPDSERTAAAAARGRSRLQDIARAWVRAFPNSASAYETLARALESSGDVFGSDDPSRSALAAIVQARTLATTREDSLRIGVVWVRILLGGERFDEAREGADALLALAKDPDPDEADQLQGIAALTGRTQRTVEMLRASASGSEAISAAGRIFRPPLRVAMSARAMLAFAALGGPADSIVSLARETTQLVQSYVETADRTAMRDAVLARPLILAFPSAPALSASRASADLLQPIELTLVRGDSAAALAGLRKLIDSQSSLLASEISLDFRFQEAWLAAQLGDTARAEVLMDRGLDAIPAYGKYLLDNVPPPAALVRMMALRADIASRRGDPGTARKWAAAVIALWSDADAELQPTVKRMRAIASP